MEFIITDLFFSSGYIILGMITLILIILIIKQLMSKLIIQNTSATCDAPVINSITAEEGGQIVMNYTMDTNSLSTPEYQIASDANFQNIVNSGIGFAYSPTVSFDMTNLADNSTYYVRVRKHCTYGVSSWTTSQFQTGYYHSTPSSATSTFNIANVLCGTYNETQGKITSYSVNGVSKSDSSFPLISGSGTSTMILYDEVNYGGGNTIQVNVQGIPVGPSIATLEIRVNDTVVHSAQFTTPYPSASNIIIAANDVVDIRVICSPNQ